MSKHFTFKKDLVELNIEGHDFQVDFEDLVKRDVSKKILAEAQNYNAIPKDGKDIGIEELKKVKSSLINIINLVLGEGSINIIFGDTDPRVDYLLQLTDFLTTEINDFKVAIAQGRI